MRRSEARRQLERLVQRQREEMDEDLRRVLADVHGRAVVYRVMDALAGLMGPTFTNSGQTVHLEGKRSVAIALLTEVDRVDSTAFETMRTEAKAKARERALLEEQAQENASDPSFDEEVNHV